MERFAQNIGRLGLVRLDGISDFLLWVSTAEHYRQYFHHTEIVLFGNETFQDLAKALPFWDHVVPVRQEQTGQLAIVGYTTDLPKFDLIINTQLHRTFPVDLFINRLHTRRAVAAFVRGGNMMADEFYSANQFYSDLLSLDAARKHEVYRNFEFLDAVTGTNATARLIRLEAFIDANKVNLPSRYAAVFPGAPSVKKAYPWPRIVKACKFLYSRYGLLSVLCGGQEDAVIAGNIQQNAPLETVNLTARLNLLEVFGVIRGATVVVSNEGMAAHAANFLGARSVCVLGGGYNSVESNIGRFLPYPSHLLSPPNTQSILQHEMPCYDCGYHCRYDPLVRDCFPCVDYVSQQFLIDALVRALRSIADTDIAPRP
jgi:ADP-heptose:LPS heptosyltransferase